MTAPRGHRSVQTGQYNAEDDIAEGVGTLAHGSDGTYVRPLKVDADGELQVDVLSMPPGGLAGVQYDDGDAIAAGTGTLGMGSDGANARALLVEADGTLHVTGGGGGVQYNDGAARGAATGTVALVDDGANLQSMAGDVNGHPKMVGAAADDAAASGNPVLVAGVAANLDGTDPGEVTAEGDVAYLRTDRHRRLFVEPQHPGKIYVAHNEVAGQANHPVINAPGAGWRIVVTDLLVSNKDVAGDVKLVQDPAGAPSDLCQSLYFGVTQGAVPLPGYLYAAENKAVGFTSTGVAIYSVGIWYFIQPV